MFGKVSKHVYKDHIGCSGIQKVYKSCSGFEACYIATIQKEMNKVELGVYHCFGFMGHKDIVDIDAN